MYVDGFVVPIKKDRIDDYRKLAELAGKVWMEHGAVSYVESIEDDVPEGKVTSFALSVKREEDEVVGFSWVTYESRQSRDEVMAKVMADERLSMTDRSNSPMGLERMFFGGFESIVDLG
ncbi:MAG: hypothetical protein QOG62_559 [Thermoleophilaceae bacterium]|jgi:uncharacterized protein YbaA (DUF1428 family)|nr:hypothetical protein [Thermoleophilaceae bacterium]